MIMEFVMVFGSFMIRRGSYKERFIPKKEKLLVVHANGVRKLVNLKV